MDMRFLGATDTVTGSKYLRARRRRQRCWSTAACSRASSSCGCATGRRCRCTPRDRRRGPDPRPHRPQRLSAAAGRAGFRGKVYCTPATRDLCRMLLPDCGHLQEEEAEYANRQGYSEAPAGAAAVHARTTPRGAALLPPGRLRTSRSSVGAGPALRASRRAGPHPGRVVRSLSTTDGRSIVFSGDLGRPHDPIMRAPAPLEQRRLPGRRVDLRRPAARPRRSGG